MTETAGLSQQRAEAQDRPIAIDAGHLHTQIEALQVAADEARAERVRCA